jgi:arylsulfatase A-like enzyme/Tfp pilus assembly protein PilF
VISRFPRTAPGTCVAAVLLLAVAAGACRGREQASSAAPSPPRPSILLVTLDTTRADAIGPEAAGAVTPAFNALAARGLRFRHAYATAPETLPSHASMMTGLYPAGHGVHENGRTVPDRHPLAAERLKASGYRTAAFVSAFVLGRRFGLSRGFDLYDDALPEGRQERTSKDTTDRALAYLASPSADPLFVWVHYFDPHAPYEPPATLAKQFASQPYHGEVAAMDRELGRLVQAFERQAPGPIAIAVVSDHGEGLGDHGESQHGHLLYQSTMRVPLVILAPGIEPGAYDAPVSTRQVFHTVLDWAGLDAAGSLRRPSGGAPEVVLGEAMKPFLEYGWQPQIMAVEGRQKVIFSGTNEVYDLASDPDEQKNLGSGANLTPSVRKALDEYPVPSPDTPRSAEQLSDEARRSLASLGYVSATATPVVRRDAPRPADMVKLFDVIEKASGLFVREDYAAAVPLLQHVLAADPGNLDATLRLATAWSALGQDARALEMFRKAAALSPRSEDVRLYLALHHARGEDWARAEPLLVSILAGTPDRLPALEALAVARERQDRHEEALQLRQRIYALREPTAGELVGLGQLAMNAQQTTAAISAFERARAAQGTAFAHDLELGVLYLASRRFDDARVALDRVPPSHPEYPMALFKRAQVSVLLSEPDRAARIELARKHADSTTRELIANEKLFR